jgi:Component of IIS longevity pathway SMK-1
VLQNVVTFKEVVDIPDDATKNKIHATFRIAYIRDAVLPRALDDASFAALHTTMIFNYMDILASLQQSPAFFQTLFEKLRTVDIHSEQAAQLMSFLQVLYMSLVTSQTSLIFVWLLSTLFFDCVLGTLSWFRAVYGI